MNVIVASIDCAPVGKQGLTGIHADDSGLHIRAYPLPGSVSVKTMHRLLLELYEGAPGATRVLAVEQPFIPQDRRKLGATLQIQRVAAWWEAAGVLAGAEEVWDPQPQTWRTLITEDRKARGLPPVAKGQWKPAAMEHAAELLGGVLPTHHVAESVVLGMWALREHLRLGEAPIGTDLEQLGCLA